MPLVSASGLISLGELDLKPGTHTLEFTIVGKIEESKGTLLGIDCVSFVVARN